MYSEYFEKLPDSHAYLERIGLGGERPEPTVGFLGRLVSSHLRSVPFENLDIYDFGLPINLSISALYDKVVRRRRGGYCFELNGLFMALLESLGYEAYAAVGRVMRNTGVKNPLAHRVTIVTIGGVRYMCDVGFGGPAAMSPVLVDHSGIQELSGGRYTLEDSGNYKYLRRYSSGGALDNLLLFRPEPFYIPDFIPLNFYISNNPGSRFRNERVINLRTAEGSLTIDNNILRRREGGRLIEETELKTHDDLRRSLDTWFGISFAEDVTFQLA